jgi:hypothetical protein
MVYPPGLVDEGLELCPALTFSKFEKSMFDSWRLPAGEAHHPHDPCKRAHIAFVFDGTETLKFSNSEDSVPSRPKKCKALFD